MAKKKRKKPALNVKQLRFCLEYLIDLNATQAAIRAGYAKKNADVQGPRLLGNAGIKQYLSKATKEKHEKLGVTADEVIRELHGIMSVDPLEMFDNEHALKPLSEMKPEVRKAISSIEVDEIWEYEGEEKVKVGETKKLKFWNKVQSAELLGKYLKLWIEKNDGPSKISIEEALELVKAKL